MEVKFEMNLKDLCIISIADSLWNEEAIVSKTKTYFSSPIMYKKLKAWDVLTKEVVSQIDAGSLPEFFYTEIVYAVDSLGKQKRDFFTYCRQRNIFRELTREQLYEHYLKKIYWTYYGTIDLEKVIKSWFHNPNCDRWKVYVMASCFCSEELIKEIWLKVQRFRNRKDFEKLHGSHGWHLGAYWDRFFRHNVSDLISDIQSDDSYFWEPHFYNETESVEKNMFKLSVGKGYKLAAKKFYYELTEKEKNKDLLKYFELATDRHYRKEERPLGWNHVATCFRENQSIEIILFLLNCCCDFDKMEQVVEDKGWFTLSSFLDDALDLMTRWPYVKLIVPFVNNIKKYLTQDHYKTLLRNMICEQRQEFFSLSMDNIYRRKFLELWKTLPLGYKEKFSKDSVLFSVWDVASLKIVLNDKGLHEIRNDNISSEGCKKFITFIEKDDQEKMKEFITLLIPTEWEEDVRINMETVYHHLMNGEFDIANKVLHSFCHSEEEIIAFKNSIHSYIICCYFIKKNQLDLANQFLSWQFNSERLIYAFKLKFIKDPFSVDHILKLWDEKKEYAEEAKIQSNNFLKWFLNSEKAVNSFIRNSLRDSDKFKNVAPYRSSDHYEIIDDLLTWCSMTKREKLSFKRTEKDLLMDKVGIFLRKNNWDAAQEFLNWLFESPIEKEEFMKKFLKSKRWVFDCILFIFNTCSPTIFGPQPAQSEVREQLDRFITTWMKPVEKRTQNDLKRFLMKWPETAFKMMKENERKVKMNSYSTDEFDIEGSEFELSEAFGAIGVGDDDDEGHIQRFLEAFRESMSLYYKNDYQYFDDSEDDYSDSFEEEDPY